MDLEKTNLWFLLKIQHMVHLFKESVLIVVLKKLYWIVKSSSYVLNSVQKISITCFEISFKAVPTTFYFDQTWFNQINLFTSKIIHLHFITSKNINHGEDISNLTVSIHSTGRVILWRPTVSIRNLSKYTYGKFNSVGSQTV